MQFSYRRRYYRRANPLLVGLIFFLVGLIFGIVAIVFWFSSQSFLGGTVSATGQIVSCRYSTNSSSNHVATANSTCRPDVRFTTQSGQEITFTSSISSSTYNKGDNVPVLYHPNHPGDARIADFVSLWLFPLIFGGMGALFLIIGFCLVVLPLLFRLLLIQGINNR
ncbi:DUF3592 domain-containing protein [Dictyobacter formicarum]|uniref:DUF3592 domain-containing protein n=1 Tax=Dictyobacter formicarum TaxID=2778368 RepID=A0ABQ3VJ69_9CHLR|nr:DUF3592 domain-containing protein [Dictyobacter formicarum]GHO85830.1 hypothetical protein KSZ_38360 [Dictyobacter formicarum]